MGFIGEFANYQVLRRIADSEKVHHMQDRLKVQKPLNIIKDNSDSIINSANLPTTGIDIKEVISIDGSHLRAKADNGFPGAEYGYITVSSVRIDLVKQDVLADKNPFDPREYRETEKVSSIECVFPGCNIIVDGDKNAKASMRKVLLEELSLNKTFDDGESLLDTYKHLLKIKTKFHYDVVKPKSPIDDFSHKDMTFDDDGAEIFTCPHSGEPLYCTDALRIHELMKPAGSNDTMYGHIMSVIEKLWFVNILRGFLQKGWFERLKHTAFILDGPLAVFSSSSWLSRSISIELSRINKSQKKVNGTDLLIFGIEKTGTFHKHFESLDRSSDGVEGNFPKSSVLLLSDEYIKNNIIYSKAVRPYGKETYFGRKFLYKSKSGQLLVPVVASFTPKQADLSTNRIDQFPRIGDITLLLDKLSSNRYENSIGPIIAAHSEAAIPTNLGSKLFDDTARGLPLDNDK